jgi:CRP/FNR family transcriptional activator FtrB
MQAGLPAEEPFVRASDIQTVRDLPLFSGMGDAEFDSLIKAAFLQRFPAQTQLIQEGDHADFLHIVVEGLVEMFASHDGRESTIGFLAPVTTFILAAVLVDKVYLQSARTLDASRILMIPAAAIRHVFERDVSFARAVVGEMAERYRGIVRQLKDQKVRTGGERLAAWVMRNGRDQSGALVAQIPCEKSKLASYLGMTPETLSRSFLALERYGVKVAGRTITCSTPAALAELALLDQLIDEGQD